MKLSTKGRHAITAMMELALRHRTGPVTLADISVEQSISVSYLEQLFARLRKADIGRAERLAEAGAAAGLAATYFSAGMQKIAAGGLLGTWLVATVTLAATSTAAIAVRLRGRRVGRGLRDVFHCADAIAAARRSERRAGTGERLRPSHVPQRWCG